MVGIRLIVIMAIVGGLIAYIADKMGSKIGKKKMSVFGLRPKHTSILLTVFSGVIISVVTICVMAIASESARTALFGMDKIQRELKSLNMEKMMATEALAKAEADVENKNMTISELDEKIRQSTEENDAIEAKLADVNAKYASAQDEVASLSEAKKQLNDEIDELEKTTQVLREGIINIREGQVFYRAGEVVYAGVMHGGLSHEENMAQINWLLQNANEMALQRLGIQNEDKEIQAIWVSKRVVDNALQTLDKSHGNMLFRIRTVANIIVGELVICDIEMTENQFIYSDGVLIYEESVNLDVPGANYNNIILNFLNRVNHAAVQAGVLPDPLTGKVGNMDAAMIIEVNNEMRRLGGKVLLKAYARGDITTAGPVLVRLEVQPDDE